MTRDADRLGGLLTRRFGQAVETGAAPEEALGFLEGLAGRGSCRAFADTPVDPALLRMLCALALCAPTKSDLQGRDIVAISDPEVRGRVDALFPDDAWIARAPAFLLFCGNNRRQRQIHEWRGRPFANDHLDAFFNAAVDAGIVMAAFVLAAEAVGLGCCPISAVRDHAQEVSEIAGLPDHVFPVAGMTVGRPAEHPPVSLRLPLAATVHENRFGETALREAVEDYDRRRADAQPYARQRLAEEYGARADYGWSEDKARQYSKPERAEFGEFVRRKGFSLK